MNDGSTIGAEELANVKRVGLIAGWGRYPVLLAQILKRSGYEVVCAGVRDHVDPELANICDVFGVYGVGKFGRVTNFFKRHSVKYAVMAGKIHKARFFDPIFIWRQVPDFYTIRFFADHFLCRRRDCNDDSLLLTVVRAFENRGITLVPGTDLAPELLVHRHLLTKRAPTSAQWQDVFFGWKLAREMGRLDVGQSVSVKNRAVLSVEAIEGTDEAIRRAGQFCRSGNFVVVKVSKPEQDMRFDVPTIGLSTIRTMAESGASVLAIEARKTMVLDFAEIIAYADSKHIAVVALIEEDVDDPMTEVRFAPVASVPYKIRPGLASSISSEKVD